MSQRRPLSLLAVLPFALACLACDESPAPSAKVQLGLKLGSDQALCPEGSQCLTAAAFGSSLKSLKVYVIGIEICESMEVQGTATGSQQGCLVLHRADYPAGWPQDPSELAGQLAVASASDEGWVDLMDPASRATLTQTVEVPEDAARSYVFGNFHALPIVKVNGTAVRAGTTEEVLHTHPGTAQTCTANGEPSSCVVSSTPLTEGPSEEAIFPAHVGEWFMFETPLTITADDVTNQAEFVLDLAFNPDGIMQGAPAPGASGTPGLADSAEGPGGAGPGANTLWLTRMGIAPVAHKAESRVVKESYLGTVTTADDTFDLRIELFSLSDDAARAVYGVNVAAIPNADTARYLVDAPNAYFLTTNGDGTITLEDYDRSPTYANLRRLDVEGETTTAEITFHGGDRRPVTFTLRSIGTLQ